MLHHDLVPPKSIFRSWVYSCKFKEDLENTRYRIKFPGSESVTYEGPVISAEVSLREVKQKDLGLVLSSEMIKRVIVNERFSVSVEILDI